MLFPIGLMVFLGRFSLDKSHPSILCFVNLDAATFLKDADTAHGALFKDLTGLSAGQQSYLLENAGGK